MMEQVEINLSLATLLKLVRLRERLVLTDGASFDKRALAEVMDEIIAAAEGEV